MQMQAFKSSTIEVVGYDKDSRKMRVAFKDRPVQEFCHVPEQLFSDFLKARSKTGFTSAICKTCFLAEIRYFARASSDLARNVLDD
ncbi:KTSC domain-containing protein [Methylomonas koyamae]|uniref:KTSC domain-containing protein n=1 Tax=Methylomonas koyamae TaxID=702114 RepID=UPI0021105521|nr:KTSC domain-containing protein [Methylomonas koyamae]